MITFDGTQTQVAEAQAWADGIIAEREKPKPAPLGPGSRQWQDDWM